MNDWGHVRSVMNGRDHFVMSAYGTAFPVSARRFSDTALCEIAQTQWDNDYVSPTRPTRATSVGLLPVHDLGRAA